MLEEEEYNSPEVVLREMHRQVIRCRSAVRMTPSILYI